MSTHFPTRVHARGMARSRSAMPPPNGGMLIFRAYARRIPPFHRRVSSTPTSTPTLRPRLQRRFSSWFIVPWPVARLHIVSSRSFPLSLSLYTLFLVTRVSTNDFPFRNVPAMERFESFVAVAIKIIEFIYIDILYPRFNVYRLTQIW